MSERDFPGSLVQEMQVRSLLGELKTPCAEQSGQKEEKKKKKDSVQMKARDKEVPSHVLSCFLPPEMIATHSQVLFFLCDPYT